MKKISAVIITKNEEDKIGRCLESVAWADEIVVVDDYSSDTTVEICRKFTKNIHQKELSDFASQKNFALSKARNDWVFVIDADERASGELAEEISRLPEAGACGYYVPRQNIIFGRLFKYGGHQGDMQLRLFRRAKARFINPIHERLEIEGDIKRLKEPLLHYSTPSLFDYTKKLNLYTDLEAAFMKARGEKVKILRLFTRPVAKFISQYFFKSGYREGMEGLIFYGLSAFYTFIKEAKFWELSQKGKKP
jgi:glycosyltransferase involved in cell wall biosynthesis